ALGFGVVGEQAGVAAAAADRADAVEGAAALRPVDRDGRRGRVRGTRDGGHRAGAHHEEYGKQTSDHSRAPSPQDQVPVAVSMCHVSCHASDTRVASMDSGSHTSGELPRSAGFHRSPAYTWVVDRLPWTVMT